MNLDHLTLQMAQQAKRIHVLVEGLSDTQARWKPDTDAWSILEVVNHLYDEEREDFRARLDHVLHHPGQTWPGIDPQGWVAARHYNERELGPSLGHFLAEREKSIAWLKTLSDPDWAITYQAPWGPIRAGDVMAAWIAHDLLHMRQLVKLHFLFTEAELSPYATRYAGTW